MRMHFHTGFVEYVLFERWVPKTSSQYAATWFVIVGFGIIYEFIRFVRARLERKWALRKKSTIIDQQELSPLSTEAIIEKGKTPFKLGVDIPRALLHFLEVGWGFTLM